MATGSVPGIFKNARYKSTSKTNLTQFYGQDKGPQKKIGSNPNDQFENEEYITNL
jgi:hypothetical protein